MRLRDIFAAYFVIAATTGFVLFNLHPNPGMYIDSKQTQIMLILMAIPAITGIFASFWKKYDQWRFPLGMFNCSFSIVCLWFFGSTYYNIVQIRDPRIFYWAYWNIPAILNCLSAVLWTMFSLGTAEWMKKFGKVFRAFILQPEYKFVASISLIVAGLSIFIASSSLHPETYALSQEFLYAFIMSLPFFAGTTILYPVLSKESGLGAIPWFIIMVMTVTGVTSAFDEVPPSNLHYMAINYFWTGFICFSYTMYNRPAKKVVSK